MKKTEPYKGINYFRPQVFLLADNGIAQSEFAGRTCYDSFSKSEHNSLKELNTVLQQDEISEEDLDKIDEIVNCDFSNVEDSQLLRRLSFVQFHHSVIEHSVVSFFIKGISRAVLQELSRHRIASYSVKSTRYTLDIIMYYYIICKYIENNNKNLFIEKCSTLNVSTIADNDINSVEFSSVYDKLSLQADKLGKDDFIKEIIPKSNIDRFLETTNFDDAIVVLLEKKKRNVGDAFKSIVVPESLKVDLVLTINLRSLKNFFDLRDSGAAWFQIQWLAQEIRNVLPLKYQNLIFKDLNKKLLD